VINADPGDQRAVPPIGTVMPEMATLGEAPENGRCALGMKLLVRLRCPSFVGSPELLFA
jgi:hypothetical protein